MKTHTLLADSITLSFGRKNILNGAWLRSETGRVTGLLGRNGSGKSSMFRAVMGQLKAQNCFVRIDDEVIPGSGCGGRRSWMFGYVAGNIFRKGCVSRYVKYLPQGSSLPSKMTLGRIFEYFAIDYGEFVGEFPKFGQYRDTPVNL